MFSCYFDQNNRCLQIKILTIFYSMTADYIEIILRGHYTWHKKIIKTLLFSTSEKISSKQTFCHSALKTPVFDTSIDVLYSKAAVFQTSY